MRIGLLDLCTSHPGAFVPILRELGCEIAAVYDSGETRPRGYAQQFAERFEIPRVYASPGEMVNEVDAVTIHSANWDRHLELARPFVEAGKPVCIDKPMVGRVRDIERLLELDRRCPGRIFGGSACPFAREIAAIRERITDADSIVSALASGPNDLFSYGIHTIAMALSVVGDDVASVQCLRAEPLGNYLLSLERGIDLHLHMHTPAHRWSLLVNAADAGPLWTTIDPSGLYGPLLERFLRFAKGEVGGWDLQRRTAPIRAAIAMQRAAATGGAVDPRALDPDEGFDGAGFAAAYRGARDRGGNLYHEQQARRWPALHKFAQELSR